MERYDIGGHDVVVCYESLPSGISGWTFPRSWGYIVLIDAGLNRSESFRQLLIEVKNIKSHDGTPDIMWNMEAEAEANLNRSRLLMNIKEEIRNTFHLE